uniref:Uncharacterized protein n=1 Tax=Cucumis melo TaxID=3656 RepID=A0A9I9EB89_CUCME
MDNGPLMMQLVGISLRAWPKQVAAFTIIFSNKNGPFRHFMDQDGEKSNTGFQVLNGVSANFHIYLVKTSYSLSPLTSSTGTASPISLKSSSVSFTSNDSMLLSRIRRKDINTHLGWEQYQSPDGAAKLKPTELWYNHASQLDLQAFCK